MKQVMIKYSYNYQQSTSIADVQQSRLEVYAYIFSPPDSMIGDTNLFLSDENLCQTEAEIMIAEESACRKK